MIIRSLNLSHYARDITAQNKFAANCDSQIFQKRELNKWKAVDINEIVETVVGKSDHMTLICSEEHIPLLKSLVKPINICQRLPINVRRQSHRQKVKSDSEETIYSAVLDERQA